LKKLALTVLAVVFAFVLSFSAFAESKDYKISIPENFSKAYKEDSKGDIAEKFNMSEKELETYFDENNIELLAVNDDLTEQIKVSIYEDDFSKSVENISRLGDDDIASIAEKMVDDTNIKYDIYRVNGITYIKLTENRKDSGGNYVATQFITVSSGKLYNISFNNAGEALIDDFYGVIGSFKIETKNELSVKTIVLTVVFAVFIAVFCAVIVVMILGIIKDKKKAKEEDTPEEIEE